MARLSTVSKILGGGATGASIPAVKEPKIPKDRIQIGKVPDQAPPVNKLKAILAGVPMSVRGRKPRLGQL